MASTTQCLLHLTTPATARSPSQRTMLNTKPNQLLCKSLKNTTPQEDHDIDLAPISRRLALTVLIGAAAVVSNVQPTFDLPMYLESQRQTQISCHTMEMDPSKWNPSKEVEYRGQVVRYEDNFDSTTNVVVTITPTDKKSITDYGSPQDLLSKVDYSLGKQAFFGETEAQVNDGWEAVLCFVCVD